MLILFFEAVVWERGGMRYFNMVRRIHVLGVHKMTLLISAHLCNNGKELTITSSSYTDVNQMKTHEVAGMQSSCPFWLFETP